MAKKEEKEITEVKFKDPNGSLELRNGMHLTPENLTIERYDAVVQLNPSFKELFNVKLNPKSNEQKELAS